MRHRIAGRQFNRTSEHRLAMRRNLVSSLFEHETISTTIEKAYGLSEEELVEWESRIAEGKYLLELERPDRSVGETEAWFAAPPAAGAEPHQDFDGPHVFQENEDSEIFSDLDF